MSLILPPCLSKLQIAQSRSTADKQKQALNVADDVPTNVMKPEKLLGFGLILGNPLENTEVVETFTTSPYGD
ncbi:hypothetical protein AMECASPLE_027870 [Ameca splendens]|uniref:Uncharacterized protein n=1 Tax=Ameca splendens TaxID=208324 RepID=A0ABV0YGT0_9TELE